MEVTTTISNEMIRFEVKSESMPFMLQGNASYSEEGDLRDFSGNMQHSDGWNASFNYSERNGVIESNSVYGVPLETNEEACNFLRAVIIDIKNNYKIKA